MPNYEETVAAARPGPPPPPGGPGPGGPGPGGPGQQVDPGQVVEMLLSLPGVDGDPSNIQPEHVQQVSQALGIPPEEIVMIVEQALQGGGPPAGGPPAGGPPMGGPPAGGPPGPQGM